MSVGLDSPFNGITERTARLLNRRHCQRHASLKVTTRESRDVVHKFPAKFSKFGRHGTDERPQS